MRTALQNFTGGEIAPTLSARYDLARYRNCLSCMENMLPGLPAAPAPALWLTLAGIPC